LRIIDARKISPETIMPPYYATDGLFRVGRNWAGKTIYDPQQVEDVTAYLMTLAD
jgi:sulfur-oxidizing protein SoxX